jgi:excinuclease ABC subunit C
MQARAQFSSQEVPAQPGVYVFRNSAGDVIYVGKAKSLRKRLSSYFQPSRQRTSDIKLRALIKSIAYYEVFPVRTEAEALLLESRLIKQYTPRYNVELRDDKRFLLIAVDLNELYPRLVLTRLKRDDNRLYFGPFPRAGALRQTVTWLSRHFGLRTCRHRRPDADSHQHCLKPAVRACSRPCVGAVTAEEYAGRLQRALAVLSGRTAALEQELEAEMRSLAERRRYEDAARTRDILENLRYVCQAGKMRRFERARLNAPPPLEGISALQQALGMQVKPEVIECFDISNIGGQMAVASMVCFRHGRPATKDYRRFRIRTVTGADDFAMMAEVIRRRYCRVRDEGRPFPDLVVVDGGPGQLSAAINSLAREGLPALAVLGLAKKHEEIYLPGRREPVKLSRANPGLKVLQAIRDEAHRFALDYHRKLRKRRIANSVLADIEGIGPVRRDQLLRRFGSVKRLRAATPAEITAAIPGIGPKLARHIHDCLGH